MGKIIRFPSKPPIPEETVASVLRDVIRQQFPKSDIWRRLQCDRATQLRTRLLVNMLLQNYDRSDRLKLLIQALPMKPGIARRLAFAIMHEQKDNAA